MLFSLSRGGYAPRLFGRLNRADAPAPAIVFSGLVILGCALISMVTPMAYNYLFGIALFGALFVWIIILLSHLAFRRRHGAEALPVRMPFFPVLQIVGLIGVGAILATMGLSPDFNISWIVGVPWLALLTAAYFLTRPKRVAAG
jgi:L-asparagine transporter-like permease